MPDLTLYIILLSSLSQPGDSLYAIPIDIYRQVLEVGYASRQKDTTIMLLEEYNADLKRQNAKAQTDFAEYRNEVKGLSILHVQEREVWKLETGHWHSLYTKEKKKGKLWRILVPVAFTLGLLIK